MSRPNEALTIVVQQFVTRRQRHNPLRARTAALLRLASWLEPGIAIINEPYRA